MVKTCQTLSEMKDEMKFAGDDWVVVEFFAKCVPCRAISPKVEKWCNDRPSLTHIKVDVDRNRSTAEFFDIAAMPTLKFIRRGEVMKEIVGANELNILSKIRECS